MRIRPLRSLEDYRSAEELQRRVWQFPDRELIPLNELVVAQKNGGYVFGAFDGRRMAAFCFGVPGLREGRVFHYSRMLGVLPGIRDQGLGRRMKVHQRGFVRRQGLDLVRWTYDPLQSRNAFFNIGKLGVIIREYLVNVYGESGSRFNRGLETDRFVVEWWIRSERVRSRLAAPASVPTLGEALSLAPAPRWKEKVVTVEIPGDIDGEKGRNLAGARKTRFQTRRSFLGAFRRGFVVTGFATGLDGDRRRSLYLLEKDYRLR